MKKRNRISKIVAILCALAGGIIAVSLIVEMVIQHRENTDAVQEQNAIELELVYAYQNPQWNAGIENAITAFEAENPDIKIKHDPSYEDKVYESVLSSKIARNELGDIVQLKTPLPYAEARLLCPIRSDVAELVTDNFTYQGEVYGLGVVKSTWGILYNKDLFEECQLQEPQNYQEFMEICMTLKRKGVTPIGVGGKDLWHMEYWTNHFFRTDVLSHDPKWLEKCAQGEVSWTEDGPKQMLTHMEELFHSGYVNENWLSTTDTSLAYKMAEQEIAMIYTGPWTATAIQELDPNMNLGWFFVPDEEGTTYTADNHDVFWGVTAACYGEQEKYNAAMRFLTFFYQTDVYGELCRETCNFSLRTEPLEFDLDPVQESVMNAFEQSDVPIPTYIGNEDTPEGFERIMLQIIRDVLKDEITVEDGLQRIQNAWKNCGEQGGA